MTVLYIEQKFFSLVEFHIVAHQCCIEQKFFSLVEFHIVAHQCLFYTMHIAVSQVLLGPRFFPVRF